MPPPPPTLPRLPLRCLRHLHACLFGLYHASSIHHDSSIFIMHLPPPSPCLLYLHHTSSTSIIPPPPPPCLLYLHHASSTSTMPPQCLQNAIGKNGDLYGHSLFFIQLNSRDATSIYIVVPHRTKDGQLANEGSI